MKLKNILNYSQPNFYSFTEESIELVEFAKEITPHIRSDLNILDVGAGSGVIGIEAKLKIAGINGVTFLELQKEFIPFLKNNIEASECTDYTIMQNSIGEASFLSESFDLIFSNPPYFTPGEGRPSPDINRQICRSFEVDGWDIFFEKIGEWLKKDGYIFFSTRELNPIGHYLEKFKMIEKRKTNSAWLVCMSRLDID